MLKWLKRLASANSTNANLTKLSKTLTVKLYENISALEHLHIYINAINIVK